MQFCPRQRRCLIVNFISTKGNMISMIKPKQPSQLVCLQNLFERDKILNPLPFPHQFLDNDKISQSSIKQARIVF